MSTQLEIVPAESRALATRQNDPGDMLRMALEKGASVDVIERLMAVRREIQAEQSKAAFDEAMAAFQAECPRVDKNTQGAQNAYVYATFEHVRDIVTPCMIKHGFHFKLDTDVESKDGWVIAICKVTHSGGHSETSVLKLPIGAGTKLMSTTQVYSAALTTTCRRVFQNAMGIVCGGEDKDGAGEKPKPRGPSALEADESALRAVAQDLWNLLKPIRGAEQNWVKGNMWLWKTGCLKEEEEAPLLDAKRFREVIAAAKKHLE